MPDPSSQRVDCVRGASDASDAAYSPLATAPAGLQLIAASPIRPYASALLMDQSGSIFATDPSSGRLYSAKAFLSALGADDRVLLSAFAGGAEARIPTPPMTLYATFKDRSSASSYFPILDGLALQIGGNTPLYDSLDSLQQQLAIDSSLPSGIAKAVLVFTDGADTNCVDVSACRARRAQVIRNANANQTRLFTVGLSSGIDVAALGELANQTGGAFLYADTAEQLLPLYGSVGKLLSLGLPTYRLQWTVRAAAPGAFKSGSSLLGRVQVTAGSRTFDVPFIVGIP